MNVTALVNTSGTVVERYLYDPYGKVTITNHLWSVITWANSKKNEILYCGYRWNPESGVYDVRHRSYHPTLGRWTGWDKAPIVGSGSLYEYCFGRPVLLVDPSGNAPFLPPISQNIQSAPPAPTWDPTGEPSTEVFPTKPQQQPKPAPKPAQRTGLLDSILKEADKRRGRGPWGNSAHHCWTACYIAARYSVAAGQVAAAYQTYEEVSDPTDDWKRDIAAQHFGAMCPLAWPMVPITSTWFFLFPSEMCDCCCLTSAKP